MSIRSLARVWWKSFLVIALVSAFIAVVIQITSPANTLFQTVQLFGIGASTIFGIASVWGLLDTPFVRRHHLIQQIRNQVSDEAKSAISQLNAEGYLSDGSLKGADLRGARLSGADLKATDRNGAHVAAILERVNFKQADLSNADMRGINLKGANLEITNLANALLIDANLSEARFTLTILSGANLKGADLTGAKFAGETCDENTILPNGDHWHEKINWSDFGAQDELPDYARNHQRMTTAPAKAYESIEQREADLRLMDELWSYINTKTMCDFFFELEIMKYNDVIFERLTAYFLLFKRPDKHFFNSELEAAICSFNEKLTYLITWRALSLEESNPLDKEYISDT